MENYSLITVIYVKCQLSVHLGKYQDLSVESRVDFSEGKCGREIGGERGITYTKKIIFHLQRQRSTMQRISRCLLCQLCVTVVH